MSDEADTVHHRTSSAPMMQGLAASTIAKLRAKTNRAKLQNASGGGQQQAAEARAANKSSANGGKSKILGPPSHTRSTEVNGQGPVRHSSPSMSKTRRAKVSLSEIKRNARRSRGVSLDKQRRAAKSSNGKLKSFPYGSRQLRGSWCLVPCHSRNLLRSPLVHRLAGSIELTAFGTHATSGTSLPPLVTDSDTINPAFARLSELNEEDHGKGVSVRSAMKVRIRG